MRKICLLLFLFTFSPFRLFTFSPFLCMAQEGHIVERLSIDTRADFEHTRLHGDVIDEACGFKGKNLNVIVSGQLSDRFSYFLRQRLNKAALNGEFFNATDRVYLDYKLSDKMTLRAGKQTIAIGGFEYDRSSIDLYLYSEYLYNVSCYAWGGSLLYDPTPHDQLIFQVTESMFGNLLDLSNVYSWNVMWYGSHGLWKTTWSANLTEWQKNHYISYLCFGNKFQLGRQVNLEVDFMNRAASGQTFLFRDCSIVSQLNYQPIESLNVFAKATYDVNRTTTDADYLVRPGTEIKSLCAGMEFFPLGDNRVRLHATGGYAFGTNTSPEGTLLDKKAMVDLGVTWRVNIRMKN